MYHSLWKQYRTLWTREKGVKYAAFYLIHYTLLFAAVAWFVFSAFRLAHVSFVWNLDGRGQHLARLIYISKTFRDSLRDLLAGRGWTFPLYDYHSGLTALDLQIGFPQILAILCPPNRMDRFYNVLVLFNYYMAGLSFSALGLYFQKKPLPVLAGAISYAFCGFALFSGVRHPHFMVAMWFLPLLIIGTEKVLKKEPSWLLLVMVFLSITTQWGLYFSCMNALLVALYMTVRFFDLYKTDRLREYVRLWGRMCIWGGIPVMLAGAVMVPSFFLLTGTGRVGREITAFRNLANYGIRYYRDFVSSFIGVPDMVDDWTILGFGVLSGPCLLWLFTRRRRGLRTLRILFVMLTFLLWIPAAGYVLSGFSNIANRFCFAYALCISAVITWMFPEEIRSWRDLVVPVIWLALYSAVPVAARKPIPAFRILWGLTAVIPGIMLLGILMRKRFGEEHQTAQPTKNSDKRFGQALQPAFLLLVCVSACVSANLLYSPHHSNYVAEFIRSPYELWDKEQYASLAKSPKVRQDTGLFRVAGSSMSFQELNMPFYYGLNGVTMYPYYGWSEPYMRWLSEMEYTFNVNRQEIYGFRTNARTLTLEGVKYFALREREGVQAPVGFTQVDLVENGQVRNRILRNENALPLGYTYDAYISREQYDTLSPLDRQESLMNCVLLEKPPVQSGIEASQGVQSAQKIPYSIEQMDGVSWKDGKLKVRKAGAKMTLSYSGVPQAEAWLRIVDLDLTRGSSGRRWSVKVEGAKVEGAEAEGAKAEGAKAEDTTPDGAKAEGAKAEGGKAEGAEAEGAKADGAKADGATPEGNRTVAYADFAADAFPYANMQHTQLVPIGFSQEGTAKVDITFPKKGIYKLQDLEIWCQPHQTLAAQAQALREETLENISIGPSSITGDLNVSQNKILCLAIPWLDGWRAYLDGEQVPLLHANTAFMAIEVPAGEHEVELRYMLPGLRSGLLISCAGILCLLCLAIAGRRKRR